jgi:hypothetical protein
MSKTSEGDSVAVIVASGFIHPETRQPVGLGDVYRTTAQNAADMISLRLARAPLPGEVAAPPADRYARRDMRSKD